MTVSFEMKTGRGLNQVLDSIHATAGHGKILGDETTPVVNSRRRAPRVAG